MAARRAALAADMACLLTIPGQTLPVHTQSPQGHETSAHIPNKPHSGWACASRVWFSQSRLLPKQGRDTGVGQGVCSRRLRVDRPPPTTSKGRESRATCSPPRQSATTGMWFLDHATRGHMLSSSEFDDPYVVMVNDGTSDVQLGRVNVKPLQVLSAALRAGFTAFSLPFVLRAGVAH